MSLHPQQPIPPVPEETARIARAAFRRGGPCLTLRDQLGTVFSDGDFANLFPGQGQPAYPPWRLALVTVMQFREGLSDRQAAGCERVYRQGRGTSTPCPDPPGVSCTESAEEPR